MLLAIAGTACLVMVVVTSVRAARRRLRYESWHLLHLYAYLGVGLALPHQLWTGQEFLASPARHRVLVGALGAARRRRAGLAGRRCRCGATPRHRLRVTSVVPEGDGVVVGAHDRPPAGPAAGRGRAVLHLAVPDGPGWTRGHPYSLSAAPDGRSLRITVKDLGDGSARLRGVRPGTRVLVEGPYGRLVRPGPHPPRGRADRRRGRHHPAAGAGRGAGLRPRRRGPAVPLHRPAAVRATSSPALPASGACRCSGCPATGGRPTPGSATAWARADDLGRADGTGCPTSPSATSTSAVRSRGPRTSAARPRGRRPRRPLPRRELRVVTAMKRIVLWFMSTVTVVILLFGYHTSTLGPLTAGAPTAVPRARSPAPRPAVGRRDRRTPARRRGRHGRPARDRDRPGRPAPGGGRCRSR